MAREPGLPIPKSPEHLREKLEDLREKRKRGEISNVAWRVASARLVRAIEAQASRKRRFAIT